MRIASAGARGLAVRLGDRLPAPTIGGGGPTAEAVGSSRARVHVQVRGRAVRIGTGSGRHGASTPRASSRGSARAAGAGESRGAVQGRSARTRASARRRVYTLAPARPVVADRLGLRLGRGVSRTAERFAAAASPRSRASVARADGRTAALALGEDRSGDFHADQAEALGGVLDVVASGLVAHRDEDRRIGRLGPGQGAGRQVQDAAVDHDEIGRARRGLER